MRRKNLWKKALAVTLSASMLLGTPADVTFAETNSVVRGGGRRDTGFN